MKATKNPGFTLAEVLITCTILGLVAALSMPAILNAANGNQSMAAANNALIVTAGALQELRDRVGITNTTTAPQLAQFINYARLEEGTAARPSTYTGTLNANTDLEAPSTTSPHLVMMDGSRIQLFNNPRFGNTGTITSTTSYFLLSVDPDGRPGGAEALDFLLYSNGFTSTVQNRRPGAPANTQTGCNLGSNRRRCSNHPSWYQN